MKLRLRWKTSRLHYQRDGTLRWVRVGVCTGFPGPRLAPSAWRDRAWTAWDSGSCPCHGRGDTGWDLRSFCSETTLGFCDIVGDAHAALQSLPSPTCQNDEVQSCFRGKTELQTHTRSSCSSRAPLGLHSGPGSALGAKGGEQDWEEVGANPFLASGTGAAGIKCHFSGTNERVAVQE